MKPIVIKPFDPNKPAIEVRATFDKDGNVSDVKRSPLKRGVSKNELSWALDQVLRICEDYDVARHVRQGEIELDAYDDDDYADDERDDYYDNEFDNDYDVTNNKRLYAATKLLEALDIIQDALNEGL